MSISTDFPELIQRHAGLIHKIAYAHCRDATDREDVVQEVVLQLWRSRNRYDPRYAETTWIYRIAHNVAISYYRRERRHRERHELLNPAALTLIEPAEPDEDVRLLLRRLDELPPLDRTLILLHLDGNDHASIADVLGISVSNVGTKLSRLKRRLRNAVESSS